MKKKLTVLMAALSALTVMSCPVMALEPQALPNDESIVQPRWTNVSRINISLDRDGNIETSIIMLRNYNYMVTVELIDSSRNVVETWEEENGDVCTSYELESGKRYYAKATVKVYNSSGKVIETATKSSSTITAR